MRRMLGLLALLSIVAVMGAGCSSTSTNSARPNTEGSQSTGAYNSSPSGPSPVVNSNSTTTGSSSGQMGQPSGGGKTTGIKPPMKDEKK